MTDDVELLSIVRECTELEEISQPKFSMKTTFRQYTSDQGNRRLIIRKDKDLILVKLSKYPYIFVQLLSQVCRLEETMGCSPGLWPVCYNTGCEELGKNHSLPRSCHQQLSSLWCDPPGPTPPIPKHIISEHTNSEASWGKTW